MFIKVLIIIIFLTNICFGDVTSKWSLRAPPKQLDTLGTYNYLNTLYSHFNQLQITTTDPNGSRKGSTGDEVIYYNGSSYTLKMCVSNTTWIDISSGGGGGSPGGVNTNVQYNNAGSFGGTNNFVFDGTRVAIGTAISAYDLTVNNGINDLGGGIVESNGGGIYEEDGGGIYSNSGGGIFDNGGGGIYANGGGGIYSKDVNSNNYGFYQSGQDDSLNYFQGYTGIGHLPNTVNKLRIESDSTNTLFVENVGTGNRAIYALNDTNPGGTAILAESDGIGVQSEVTGGTSTAIKAIVDDAGSYGIYSTGVGSLNYFQGKTSIATTGSIYNFEVNYEVGKNTALIDIEDDSYTGGLPDSSFVVKDNYDESLLLRGYEIQALNSGSPSVLKLNSYGGEIDLGDNQANQDIGIIGQTIIATHSNTQQPLSVQSNLGVHLFDILNNGNIGINNSSPLYSLDINGNINNQAFITTGSIFNFKGELNNTDNKFNVNATGNIIKINNVTTSWPSSQGAANTYLKNDGSGNFSWSSASSVVTTISLTNQSADIGSTNFSNTSTAGLYRVSYSLEDTTTDVTAGAVTLTIAYTDDAGSASALSAAQVLTTAGRTQGTIFIQSASGSISYSTTHTGLFGSAKYAVYASVERVL